MRAQLHTRRLSCVDSQGYTLSLEFLKEKGTNGGIIKEVRKGTERL